MHCCSFDFQEEKRKIRCIYDRQEYLQSSNFPPHRKYFDATIFTSSGFFFFLSFFISFVFLFFFDTVKNVETHPSFHDASPKCKIDRAVGSCRHCRVTGASVLAPRVFDTTICVDPTIWYSTIDYLSIRHCEYQFTPHYLFWRTNLFARSFGRIIHDPSGKRMT